MTRIVAGTFRGRPLQTPRGDRTRPTSDRTREALFSALAVWADAGGNVDRAMERLNVLDCFAGSGAVGLEAASRGADHVTLVEKDRATADLIRANARTLGARVEVVTGAVETFLARAANRAYDVCWFDAPYAVTSTEIGRLLGLLAKNGYVAAGGVVVVERAARGEAPAFPPGFTVAAPRRYGEASLHFAYREDA